MSLLERGYIPKALVKTGYSCNNNCLLCHSSLLRVNRDLRTDEIINKARIAASQGAGMVVLSGGEPTIRRDIVELCKGLNAEGLETGVVTNGRMFAYPKLLNSLVGNGLNYAFVSLFGDTAALHNRHVRTDSFFQTMAGLKNLADAGIETTVNVVITAWNVLRLASVAERLCGIGPIFVKFSLAEPKGAFIENAAALAIHPADAANAVASVKRAFAKSESEGLIRILCDAFTPCLVPGSNDFQDNLLTHYIYWMSETIEDGFFQVDFGDRAKTAGCFECSYYDECPGIYKWYFEKYGTEWLKPEKFKMSNSFVFMPMESGAARKCLEGIFDIPEGRTGPPERYLYMRGEDKAAPLTIHYCESRDFQPRTIASIKSETRMLYFAAGAEHFDDVFGGTAFPVAPAEECAACRCGGVCPGVFIKENRPASKDAVNDIISNLSGNVLDVGPGKIFYSSTLSRLIAEKRIRYTAVDPDPITGDHPVFNECGVLFIRGKIEELSGRSEKYDVVLMMGSLNHIRDITRALQVVRGLLAPTGRVILADSGPIGIISEKRICLREADSAVDYEHFRNFGMDAATLLLEEVGFDCVHKTSEEPFAGVWIVEAVPNSRSV